MFRRTLWSVDEKDRGRERVVSYAATTMSAFRYADGDWGLYDNRDGVIYSIKLHQTGLFVVGEDGIMFGTTEVSATRYEGVL